MIAYGIILCIFAGLIIALSLFLLITQSKALKGIPSSNSDLLNMYVPFLHISTSATIYICLMFLLMWFFELPDSVCVFYKVTEQICLILVQTHLFGIEVATLFKIYIPRICKSWKANKLKTISLFIGFLTSLSLLWGIYIARGQFMWSMCTGDLPAFFERKKQAKKEISWLYLGHFTPYLCLSVVTINAYGRKVVNTSETDSSSVLIFNKALAVQIPFFTMCLFSRGIYISLMPSNIDLNLYRFVFWCLTYSALVILGPSTSVLVLLFNNDYKKKVFSILGRNSIAPLNEE